MGWSVYMGIKKDPNKTDTLENELEEEFEIPTMSLKNCNHVAIDWIGTTGRKLTVIGMGRS